MTQLEMLQSVSQQQLSSEVKKSLLVAAVHGYPVFTKVCKFDQNQVIHGWKTMSLTKYFDLLI